MHRPKPSPSATACGTLYIPDGEPAAIVDLASPVDIDSEYRLCGLVDSETATVADADSVPDSGTDIGDAATQQDTATWHHLAGD